MSPELHVAHRLLSAIIRRAGLRAMPILDPSLHERAAAAECEKCCLALVGDVKKAGYPSEVPGLIGLSACNAASVARCNLLSSSSITQAQWFVISESKRPGREASAFRFARRLATWRSLGDCLTRRENEQSSVACPRYAVRWFSRSRGEWHLFPWVGWQVPR